MSLDLAEGDSLHWVGLQHAFDEVFDVRRNLPRNVIVALLDFREKEGQLLVIKW